MMKINMRKNRVLGLLLSSVMLLTMFAIPAYAEETLPAPVHDTFSSFTTDTFKAAYSSHVANTIESDGWLKLPAGSAYAFKDFTNNPITGGKIKVTTTIKTNNNSSVFGVMINNWGSNANNIQPIVCFYNGKAYYNKIVENEESEISAKNNLLTTYTVNNEYKIEATIDMTKKIMNVKMTDLTAVESTPVEKSNISITSSWSQINRIGFGVRNGSNPMYAKDLHIEYLQDVTVTPLLLPVNDTFSSMDNTKLKASYTNHAAQIENNQLMLPAGSAYAYKDFTTNPITKGKIKVSATITPNNTSVLGFIHDGNVLKASNARPILFFKNGKVYKFVAADWEDRYFCDFTSGEKYKIEAIIDMDNKTMNIEMKGLSDGSVSNGSINITNYRADKDYPVNSITAIGFAVLDGSNKMYAENLDIEYVQDGAPTLTNDNVKFYVDNTEISKEEISTKLDKIVLDFGDIMDPESFTNNEVTLTKKTTGELIKVNASITGSTYTINIPSQLTGSADYVLNVSKDVKNAVGTAMGTAYNMEFNVKGEFNATLSLKNSDGTTDITKFSQLKAGENIKTNISFENTTDKDATAVLLYGYYEGNKLKNVSFVPITLSKATSTGTAISEHTVESLDGVTKVKVMLWNGFGEIKPLAEFIEL